MLFWDNVYYSVLQLDVEIDCLVYAFYGLTDEWQERGITAERDFSILTAEIAKATFGITPSEHKDLKGLTRKNENLRDHMTDLDDIHHTRGKGDDRDITGRKTGYF